MKKLIVILMVVAILVVAGCESNNSSTDKIQEAATERLVSEAQRQVGMPGITNFQQRKLMKMVYEMCDREDLTCYAYIKSDYNGTLHYIGQCIGFGIPFSAQFTNPEKLTRKYSGGNYHNMPQPDPNGLFMPTSSSATWLMMVDPKTKEPRPVYIEPEIIVSPFRLD